MSVYDYDLAEAKKQFNSVITNLVMMTVMHFWLKFTQHLIVQSLLPWKNFFCVPVVKIRIFGCPAEGKLERPWKVASPFGDLMGQMFEEAKPEEAAEATPLIEGKKETTTETKKSKKREQRKEEVDGSVTSASASVSESESKASGVKSRKPRKEE